MIATELVSPGVACAGKSRIKGRGEREDEGEGDKSEIPDRFPGRKGEGVDGHSGGVGPAA